MKAICLVGKFAHRVLPAGTRGDRSYMDEKLFIRSVCGEIITIERYKKRCEGEIVKLPAFFNDHNWEPVSDPHFAKGDKVRAIGKSIYGADIEGKTFEVVDPDYHSAEHGDVVRLDGGYLVKSENLEKCDPCEGCQKIAMMNESCEYWKSACEEARKRRDGWEATAQQHCRNATYWREELEKLQKEALTECQPLDEVAKIYIQISPEVLERILKERD